MKAITCAECAIVFDAPDPSPARPLRKFCSRACHYAYHQSHPKIYSCKQCGATFEDKNGAGKRGREYCSRSCVAQHWHDEWKRQYEGRQEKECTGCRQVLSLEQFSRCPTTYDGRRARCLKCVQQRRLATSATYTKLPDDAEKVCVRCGASKPVSEFWHDCRVPGGYKHTCRDCMRPLSPEALERSREIKRAFEERLKKLPPSERRRRQMQAHVPAKYGISYDEYEALFTAQNGKCGICGCALVIAKGKAGLDHDHRTGKVREFLCNRCNHALGMLQDDVNLVEAFAAYLRKHASQ